LQATAEANNLAAVAAAKETYTALMEGVCGGAQPYLSTAHLEIEHQKIKEISLNQFINKWKVGGESFSAIYKEKLDQVSL
jgi:atlastin